MFNRSLLVLLLSGGLLFGAHNLLVNGSTDAYISFGDSVVISLFTESNGATVKLTLYVDENGDGIHQSWEVAMGSFQIKEGSSFDEDETPNGYLTGGFFLATEMGYVSGDFVLVAEDGNVEDTAILHFLPISSSLSISGYVVNPSVSGITILLGRDTSNTDTIKLANVFGTFTDPSGSFSINVPDEFFGDTFLLFPVDIVGKLSNYVSPELPAGTYVLTGDITGVTVSFTATDLSNIYGTVMDNFGNIISDSVRILFMGVAFSLFDTSLYATSTWTVGGSYNRQLKSNWGSFWVLTSDLYGLYPHYLSPPPLEGLIIGQGSASVNIVAYLADTTISGTVYLNNQPGDEVGVKAKGFKSGNEIGSTFTLTYSDGHYVLRVSSDADSYQVYLDEESLPPFSTVVESLQTVSPGATGVDFHVTYPVPGDANGDGMVSVGDLVYLANYIFTGGPGPNPQWLGDENCDGYVNSNDISYLALFLFAGGPEPIPCYPTDASMVREGSISFFNWIASQMASALKSLLK
jgi:hypothetical protein